MNDFLTAIIAAIPSLLGGILIGRGKRKAEADSIVIDNASKVLELYGSLKSEMQEKFRELKQENADLRKRVDDLEQELNLEKKRTWELQEENSELRRRLEL